MPRNCPRHTLRKITVKDDAKRSRGRAEPGSRRSGRIHSIHAYHLRRHRHGSARRRPCRLLIGRASRSILETTEARSEPESRCRIGAGKTVSETHSVAQCLPFLGVEAGNGNKRGSERDLEGNVRERGRKKGRSEKSEREEIETLGREDYLRQGIRRLMRGRTDDLPLPREMKKRRIVNASKTAIYVNRTNLVRFQGIRRTSAQHLQVLAGRPCGNILTATTRRPD